MQAWTDDTCGLAHSLVTNVTGQQGVVILTDAYGALSMVSRLISTTPLRRDYASILWGGSGSLHEVAQLEGGEVWQGHELTPEPGPYPGGCFNPSGTPISVTRGTTDDLTMVARCCACRLPRKPAALLQAALRAVLPFQGLGHSYNRQ